MKSKTLLVIGLLVMLLAIPVTASFTPDGVTVTLSQSYGWNWPDWVIDLVQDFCDAHPDICQGECRWC